MTWHWALLLTVVVAVLLRVDDEGQGRKEEEGVDMEVGAKRFSEDRRVSLFACAEAATKILSHLWLQ